MSFPSTYDLHLHTCWSYDATAEAEIYFRRGRELGVSCLAITDHYSLDSWGNIQKLQSIYPEIKVIVAAELTVKTSIGSVDLLCYHLPPRPEGKLAAVMEEYRLWSQASGLAMSQGMQSLGFPYTDDERMALLRTYRPERVLQKQGMTRISRRLERAHFVSKGYLACEADFAFLQERCEKAVPTPPYPQVSHVVEAVKEADGFIVLAHPSHYFLGADRFRMDLLRAECFLDGIECAHPRVDAELTPQYRAYCVEHGLLSTAGSDCHTMEEVLTPPTKGDPNGKSCFASHLGAPEWLDEFLDRIR